jgi:hypothetical protein
MAVPLPGLTRQTIVNPRSGFVIVINPAPFGLTPDTKGALTAQLFPNLRESAAAFYCPKVLRVQPILAHARRGPLKFGTFCPNFSVCGTGRQFW